MVASLILTSINFCIVGGLYHAVSKHEAKRIDTYLVILCIMWVIGVIFNFIVINSGEENSGFFGVIVNAVIWGLFVWYTHGYADLIRKLSRLGYPVDTCRF
jgi:hypothetical protein